MTDATQQFDEGKNIDQVHRLLDEIVALYRREEPSIDTEFRIIYHLMTIALAGIRGAIGDDEAVISEDEARDGYLRQLHINFPIIREEAAKLAASVDQWNAEKDWPDLAPRCH